MPGPLFAPLCAVKDWIYRGECYILPKRELGRLAPLIPNAVQVRILRAMLEQAREGRPVRITIPKARKEGVSTIVQAVQYGLCRAIDHTRALTVAHSADAVTQIFRAVHRMHTRGQDPERPGKLEIGMRNGSAYMARTARGTFVGSGDTVHFLHISELAKCQTEAELDSEALASLISAVPQDEPGSMIVIESSGQGDTGEFPRRCRQAEAGQSEYRLLFIPWTADPDYVRDVPAEGLGELDREEDALRSSMGVTDGQLAWRRYMLRSEYGSDLTRFRWDYPATLDECFDVAEGRLYPTFGAAHVGKPAETRWAKRYRAVDFGWSGEHLMVWLWAMHDPASPPRLLVDPACPETIRQMRAIRYNTKTGRPLDQDDHAPDALRYMVGTFGMTGLVYVYRELVIQGAANRSAADIAREVHRLSGWHLPADADPADVARHVQGDGEEYEGTVGDRRSQGWVGQFDRWGLNMIPHMAPDMGKLFGGRMESRGEVEDGIALLRVLIAGDALVYGQPALTVAEQARRIVHSPEDAQPHVVSEELRDAIQAYVRAGSVGGSEPEPCNAYFGDQY